MTTKTTSAQQKSIGLGAALLAILLILVLTLVPASADTQVAANAHPALLAMAAEQPDTQVRVLIQKSDVTADVPSLVTRLGGTVIHELNLINAVAAEMTVATAVDLSFDTSVSWVSIDGLVESGGKPSGDRVR